MEYYYFHLLIIDTDLAKACRGDISMDDDEIKRRTILECQKNPWYYFREIHSKGIDPKTLIYFDLYGTLRSETEESI